MSILDAIKKPKKTYISGALKGKLRCTLMQQRRETLYKMISKKNDGSVPCFCCGKHVREKSATIEHIIPLSKGGTDDMKNLSISHNYCNMQRGNGD